MQLADPFPTKKVKRLHLVVKSLPGTSSGKPSRVKLEKSVTLVRLFSYLGHQHCQTNISIAYMAEHPDIMRTKIMICTNGQGPAFPSRSLASRPEQLRLFRWVFIQCKNVDDSNHDDHNYLKHKIVDCLHGGPGGCSIRPHMAVTKWIFRITLTLYI